ncbi:MAG: hypothetical protein IKA46_07485 [Clostridia bacterium]|nr:hypothetical protein [Clostridia bacterium]
MGIELNANDSIMDDNAQVEKRIMEDISNGAPLTAHESQEEPLFKDGQPPDSFASEHHTSSADNLPPPKRISDMVYTVKQCGTGNGMMTLFSIVLYALVLLGMVLNFVLPRTVFGLILRIWGMLVSGVLAFFAFGFLDSYIAAIKKIKIYKRKLLGIFYSILVLAIFINVIVIVIDTPWEGSSFKHAAQLTTDSPVELESVDGNYYVKFVPDENDTYIFTATYSASLKLYDENRTLLEEKRGDAYSKCDTTFSYNMKAGDTYYVVIRSSGYFETVCVKKGADGDAREKAISLSDGVGVSVTDTNSSKHKYYKYTPSITGMHQLSLSSYDANVNVYDSLTSTSNIASNDFRSEFSVHLTAGTTYYFEVWVADGYSDSQFTFLLKAPKRGGSRELAIRASLDTSYSVSAPDSEPVYYRFTPRTTDIYTFQSIGSSSGDPDIKIYNSLTSSFAMTSSTGSGHFNFNYELTAGTTYYIEVYNDNGSGYSFTFTVSEAVGWDRESAIEASLDTNYSISATSSAPVYYKFTPSATGTYNFQSTGSSSGDPDIRIYSSLTSTSTVTSNTSSGHFNFNYTLNAGTTYYIEVYNGSNGSYTFDFTVDDVPGSSRDFAINASLGTNYSISATSSAPVYYKFTPSTTGTYIFQSTGSSSGDPDIRIYNSLTATSTVTSNTSSGHFNFNYTLNADTTYYIAVYNGSYSGYTFDFVIGMPAQPNTRGTALEASLGTIYFVSAIYSAPVYYKFTPSVTGTYIFQSTGSSSGDPDIEIYNSLTSTSTVASNTSSGHFNLSYTLNAGTTYYVEVYNDSYSDYTFNFTVNVPAPGSTRDTALQASLGTNYSISATSSAPVYYKFTPSVTGTYIFQSTGSSSGDPNIKIYNSLTSTSTVTSNTSSGHFNFSYTLNAGTTYYVEVYNYSGNATFTFTIS